jgi:hypothetical protein
MVEGVTTSNFVPKDYRDSGTSYSTKSLPVRRYVNCHQSNSFACCILVSAGPTLVPTAHTCQWWCG